MGAIEPWHLILLLAIVLLVLGPGKLPEVGKSVGDALREFRKATSGLQDLTKIEPPTAASPTNPPSSPVPPAAPPATPDATPAPGGTSVPTVPADHPSTPAKS